MIRHLRRFAGDNSGVTAVELALIAPAVILIYFATTQLVVGMAAERRASHVASAISDLVAQNADTTKDKLAAVMRIGPTIMDPFPATTPTPLKMRITSIVVDNNGSPKVAWSRGEGMSPLGVGTVVNELPAVLRISGDAFIYGEVQYDYTLTLSPTLMKALFGADGVWTFNRQFFLRPRRGAAVDCTDC